MSVIAENFRVPGSDWLIRRDDLRGAPIRALLEEHLQHMRTITPPESVHALDLAALRDHLSQPRPVAQLRAKADAIEFTARAVTQPAGIARRAHWLPQRLLAELAH